MKNKIEDLRNHLFETLEALKDPEKPMDLDRARTVAEVAKVVIDTAKVEVDFLKVAADLDNGDPAKKAQVGTGFMPVESLPPPETRPPLRAVSRD